MDGSVPRQLLLFQCRNQHRQVVPVPFEIFHCDEKNGKTTETQETKRNNIRHSKENVFTTTTPLLTVYTLGTLSCLNSVGFSLLHIHRSRLIWPLTWMLLQLNTASTPIDPPPY
jgi:hypothetical protein